MTRGTARWLAWSLWTFILVLLVALMVLGTVTDDGRGFDTATTPRGSGLQNMADRVEALGGMLEIRSARGEGTTVAGRLPLVAGGSG